MTLLDESQAAVPVGAAAPAGRADLTRASLEALAALAGDVLDDAARIDGAPLPDVLELLADLDAVIGTLGLAREGLEGRARQARGWARNRWADPERGIRAERSASPRKTWNIPSAVDRVAGLLNVDPDTGEIDNPLITTSDVKRIVRRWLAFASTSSMRSTVLDQSGVEYDDLVTVEKRPARVRVYRETPAAPAAGGAE